MPTLECLNSVREYSSTTNKKKFFLSKGCWHAQHKVKDGQLCKIPSKVFLNEIISESFDTPVVANTQAVFIAFPEVRRGKPYTHFMQTQKHEAEKYKKKEQNLTKTKKSSMSLLTTLSIKQCYDARSPVKRTKVVSYSANNVNSTGCPSCPCS